MYQPINLAASLAMDLVEMLADGGGHDRSYWWPVDTTPGAWWLVCKRCGYLALAYPDGTTAGYILWSTCDELSNRTRPLEGE